MTELSDQILYGIESVIGFKNRSRQVGLHEPFFEGTNAWEYVKNCIDTGWVSNAGEWVNRFENEICSYTGATYSVAVSNGTDGLRLALHILGVKNGDEVLIPPLSFVATANAVSHLGAIPHFVDIDKNSLNLCPRALEARLNKIAIKKKNSIFNKETGRRISAILPVHVFGNPADLLAIKKIAKNWNLPIIEDAAEALGSWHKISNKKNVHCGLLGDVGVISFNGNKLITTGGGGIIITNNPKIAKLSRHLSTTAKLKHQWEFDHDYIAWNDRLPNINAALGLAQLELIQERLELKKNLLTKYKETFNPIKKISLLSPINNSISNNWLITLQFNFDEINEIKIERQELLRKASDKKINLRPIWKPLHKLSIYKKSPKGCLKFAENSEFKIINIPSSPQLLK